MQLNRKSGRATWWRLCIQSKSILHLLSGAQHEVRQQQFYIRHSISNNWIECTWNLSAAVFISLFAEFGNRLVQAMALYFALTLTALLCWGRYLAEMMSECISLPLLRIDVDYFFYTDSHDPCSCLCTFLILLFHSVGILQGLWNMVSSWYKTKTSFGWEDIDWNMSWSGQSVCGRVWERIWAGSYGGYQLPLPRT